MKLWPSGIWVLVATMLLTLWGVAAAERTYVGSRTCASCHEQEYKNYSTYAKKSHSFNAVEKMAAGLTAAELRDCYTCHTTGYGKPGGFVSKEATPELRDAGCEVCHGPGSAHAESGAAADIDRHPTMETCQTCHTTSRVAAFSFRPLIFGGAH
jgi:hypothetical protein